MCSWALAELVKVRAAVVATLVIREGIEEDVDVDVILEDRMK